MVENQTVSTAPSKPSKKTRSKTSQRKLAGGEDTIDAILVRLQTLRSESSNADTNVIGVTSCARRAGVSTLVGKMAVRAAEMVMGRVLLVDANLDHPRQARNFGLKRKEGLAEALLGDGNVCDKYFNGAVDGLSVMPAGAPFKRNSNTSPESCSAVMKELRTEFDLIFVDLPPIADSAKFLMLAQQTDGIAIVADAKATRAREIGGALQILEGSGVPIIGTILNRKIRTLPKWIDRWI